MTVVMVFGEEEVGVICAYTPRRGRPESEKHQLCDMLACEWDLQNEKEFVLGLGDFNGHVGEQIDGFEGMCMEEME